MSSLLHLDASHAAGDHSVTRRLTSAYVERWRSENPSGTYRLRALASAPVPFVGPGYVSLGERVEQRGVVPHTEIAATAGTDDERREWDETLPLVEELMSADVVLFGIPMYNFTVPVSLKSWIDRVTFPGVFTDAETGEALLGGLETVVVMSRGGGGYSRGGPREELDFQESYMRAYLSVYLQVPEENQSFVGVEFTRSGDIPALAGFAAQAETSYAEAEHEVAALARRVPAGT